MNNYITYVNKIFNDIKSIEIDNYSYWPLINFNRIDKDNKQINLDINNLQKLNKNNANNIILTNLIKVNNILDEHDIYFHNLPNNIYVDNNHNVYIKQIITNDNFCNRISIKFILDLLKFDDDDKYDLLNCSYEDINNDYVFIYKVLYSIQMMNIKNILIIDNNEYLPFLLNNCYTLYSNLNTDNLEKLMYNNVINYVSDDELINGDNSKYDLIILSSNIHDNIKNSMILSFNKYLLIDCCDNEDLLKFDEKKYKIDQLYDGTYLIEKY